MPTVFRQIDELQHERSQRIVAWTRLCLILITLGFVIVLVRVAQLKVTPDEGLLEAAGTTTSTQPHLTRRGDLIDRRGRIIATSSIGYRLFLDPQLIEDLDTIAVELGHLLDLNAIDIDRTLIPRRDRRYVPIHDRLADWQIEAVRQANLPGVALEPRLVRHYLHDQLAGLVVGKVGFEHTGLGGMEHRFNDRLAPIPGTLRYMRDAHHRPLWIEPDGYSRGQNGDNVRLSIDLLIQEYAENRLREAVEHYRAAGGRLVVLDPRTGELLALCDILNDDPYAGPLTEDPLREVHPSLGRNRNATDPYEPGSTFKPFVWATAIELGRSSPDEILDCPTGSPYVTSFGRRIRDAYYYGPSSFEKVLIKSMNSGMAIVAERMTHREMRHAIGRFGFGRETNCGLTGESAGIVTSAVDWSDYTQTSVCMGHEIAVTPLQMVRAFAAFARQGTVPELRITAAEPEERRYQFIQRVLSPRAAKRTREAMRKVMTEGSGRRAQSEQYQLFGKSGTSQLPNPEGGGYYEDRYIPSFIAGAPFNDPRIVVLCVLDDPDKEIGHYGGAICGPIVRDVIDHTLSYLGVPPDKQPADAVAAAD